MLTKKVGAQMREIKMRCDSKIKPNLCFPTCYAFSAVLQQGHDGFAQMALLACDKLEEFEEVLIRLLHTSGPALELALYAIRSAIEEHEIVDIISCLPKLFAKFCTPAAALSKTPAGTCLVRRCIVTPSKVILLPPQIHCQNRIVRKFDPEFSLRVSFRDDNMQNLSYSLMSGHCRHMVIERVVARTLRDGLVAGNRRFRLLTTSCCQLRDHGAWLDATDAKGYSSEMIRYWMGDFSGIASTAKKMTRMGQCFSSTEESVQVPLLSNSVREVPDILGLKHPVTDEHYIFSDGIGMILPGLLKEVTEKIGLTVSPSAIQIRYAGYKGMLCVNPLLSGRQLVLKKSMRKFNCVNSECIEVIKISTPRPVFLNRQLITLLEQLGVPSRVFFCLQQRMVTLFTEALVSDSVALQVLETYVGPTLPFSQLLRHGFSLTRDPFVRSILFAVYRTSMESLLSKTRIAVPRNLGRNMFGVLDETRTLKYGQVFVQFTSLGSSTRQKNGPQVFILSGSDLGGDEYFVIWDSNLFFPGPNQEPMIYGQKVQQQRSELSPHTPLPNTTIVRPSLSSGRGGWCMMRLPVAPQVTSPGFRDMLLHGQDEVVSLLAVWSGVHEVRIRRGADRGGGRHIVVSSVGRDWQCWFLEELLLQPWLATAVEKRSLEQFIRG
ncbi:hypothetical protein V5799_013336 [Amblyomma americanum]|uniref:RNA-dependent RNA polymerase n=1 Tax=Amblyomma americanum TaxID=6943 RepID=A0AAQ4E674_AMBAM